MVLVRPVREVEPGDVHPCVHHLGEHVDGAAGRPDGTHDARHPLNEQLRVDVELTHRLEAARRVGRRRLLLRYRVAPTRRLTLRGEGKKVRLYHEKVGNEVKVYHERGRGYRLPSGGGGLEMGAGRGGSDKSATPLFGAKYFTFPM